MRGTCTCPSSASLFTDDDFDGAANGKASVTAGKGLSGTVSSRFGDAVASANRRT